MACRTGERAHAVVRPEKLVLQQAGDTEDANRPSVEGQVESSLYLGTATQMVVTSRGRHPHDRAWCQMPTQRRAVISRRPAMRPD